MADNVTTTDLEVALQQLASQMGLSVVEYVESLGYSTVTELLAKEAGLQAQIDAITELDGDNGVVSIAEKVKAINDTLTDNTVVDNIISQILANKQAVLDEKARAEGVEAGLQTQITTNKNKTDSNETARLALGVKVDGIDARLTTAEGEIATLKGGDTVVGSVAKSIKDALDPVKSDLTGEIARAKLAEGANKTQADGLQAQIDSLTSATSGNSDVLAGRVTTLENRLDDTLDTESNVVKGIETRVEDLEALTVANEVTRVSELATAVEDLKAYSDARDLKASSMDTCLINNSFRASLGLADSTCAGTSGGGDGGAI